MVFRKKNLLDAFREAAPEGRLAPQQPTAPSAGGPFAKHPTRPLDPIRPQPEPSATGAKHPPKPPASPAASDFEMPSTEGVLSRTFKDPTVRLVVLVAAVVAVIAWSAGRLSSGAAAAAGSSGEAASGPGLIERDGAASAVGADLAQRNLSAAKMGNEDDRAFMDPRNRFTVRVIQYDNNAANLEKARATAEHLRRKEGVPIVGPISMGGPSGDSAGSSGAGILVLCAGHEQRIDDLAGLLKHLKALSGPPPQKEKLPFAGAYVVNIDDVVKRR